MVTLEESLALTALVAHKDPRRHSRYAVRWLRRLLLEHERMTIEEALLAASCLVGGASRDQELRRHLLRPRCADRERVLALAGGEYPS